MKKFDDIDIKDLDNTSSLPILDNIGNGYSSETVEDDFDYEIDDVDPDDEIVDYVSPDVAERLLENENKDRENENAEQSVEEVSPEKKHFWTKIKEDLPSMFTYFLVFAGLIVFWEVVIRTVVSGTVKPKNLWFLLFVPAEAMFLTMLCGFFKKKKIIDKIIFTVVILFLCIIYITHLIYFKNFGSLFSVSLLGMGTKAVGNFGWAVTDTIKHSVGLMCLIVVPALAAIVIFCAKVKMAKRYCWPLRGFVLLAVVALWLLAGLGLRLGGTDRASAYYAYYNSMADTDTTATYVGAMTTTVIEGASYFLGLHSSNDVSTMEAVNNDALNLGNTPEPAVSANTTVSSNETADTPEVIEEDPFVPEPHINEDIDFLALYDLAPDEATQNLCGYFESKEPTYTNEYTGMFEGYNLIYICAESYSNLALDEEVTPTLYKMAHEGIVLNNFYNSFLNTTTNGEYAFQTSLWPDVSRYAANGTAVGSFAQSAEVFMPYGLGDLFGGIEVPTFAYHNYYGHYYRRGYSWPNLGYDTIKFMGEGMVFTYTWPASDLELIEQSIDDYLEEDQFVAYYMTFSGHGPYSSSNCMYNKNLQTVRELLGDRANDLTYDAIGYLACNYELELAMEYLLERLEEEGKLDNTLIVICGDHTPYYMSDDGKQSLADYEIDADFELYRSSCIMYNAGLEEPIVTDTYCCNVDILPTVLNLFGVEYDSRLLMGNDIFSDGIHRARIYNNSFLTNIVKYNASTGETIWQPDSEGYTEEQLNAYLEAMISYTEAEYSASVKLLANNFYFFIWRNSGLLTEEEILAEIEREQEASQRAADEAAAEQALQIQQEQEAALAAMGLNPDGTPIEGWEDPNAPVEGENPEGTAPPAPPEAQPETQPEN